MMKDKEVYQAMVKEEFVEIVELLEECRQVLQENNWRGDIQERILDALESGKQGGERT